jgi:nickel-dependent lactate racemase
MRWDIKQKLGSRLARILDVHPHNPYENLVFMGTSKFGISIFINKIFAESDLKLAIGSITPHESVGFGGGRKTVAIGLAGIETLANFHNRDEVVMTGEIHPNPQHDNLIEIAQKAGLEFIINSVFAPSGNMSALVVGDPIQAHLTGVNLAKKLYATPMPPEADIVILNAYPKDTDLLQSCMALNVTFFPNQHIVRSGGTIVITSACPEGTGMHFLAGSGMRNPVSFAKETFKNYHLVIVSPNLTRNEVLRHFPENVNFYNRWRETLQALVRLHGNRARVAIYPHAPLHLPEESK